MTWSVQVEGVKLPQDEHMIRTTLEDLGVEPWTFKRRAAESTTIRREIADRLPNVTWVGFEYRGTVANVKVVEKTLPDLPEPTSPRHLVASKKAVIHDIFVEEGQPLVKPNELVRAGDVLVSGIIGSENAPQIVSADGQVFGEVWYETNLTLPLDVERTVLTGERKDRYYLQVGPLSVPVWGIGDPEFDKYKIQDREYAFSIREWTFPLAFKKEELLASKQVIQNLTEEEELQLGSRLSRQKLLSTLDGEVEIEDENILKKRIEHGKVYIKTHYTVIEDITSEQYIFNQGD
jgi:similar to stage IV sporulation protein